jgi:hypothetical protein
MTSRSAQNRTKNYTGTVHYADSDGKPACGTQVHGWNMPSVATVTCSRCIASYGEDEAGYVDKETTHYADDHAARRAKERAARMAGM